MSDASPLPTAGKTQAICYLNRRQMRSMGLSSGKVLELYDQARDSALAEGCTCGVSRIQPLPKGDGTFHVNVYHEPGCEAHPLEERRKAMKRWRRLRLMRLRAEQKWRAIKKGSPPT